METGRQSEGAHGTVLRYLIESTAGLLSHARKGMQLANDPSLLDTLIPSTLPQMECDWHNAIVHICSDILNQEIHFTRVIELGSIIELERISLGEVKTLNAYYIWTEKTGKKVGTIAEAQEDLLEASAGLNEKLLASPFNKKELKAGFDFVEDYLKKNQSTMAQNKLSQIQTMRKLRSGEEAIVNKYVKEFYGNIIPAVKKASSGIREKHTERVFLAIRSAVIDDLASDIVNCFEAALAIYFLDKRIVNKIFSKHNKDGQFFVF